MYKTYKDDAEYYAEIDRLKDSFFSIKGNYQSEALGTLNKECESFLLYNESEEIEDLLAIVIANRSYFSTKEKDQAREITKEVWEKLSTKYEMSLYDIRILNAILFVAKTPEEMFKVTQKCLNQLERYRYDDLYIRIRMPMLLNLTFAFVDYKFELKKCQLNTVEKMDYDTIINDAADELIELNAKNKLQYNECTAFAMIYKAIANEDKIHFYSGVAFLKTVGIHEMADDTIKFYLNKYNIEF
jgi:hypothetical protein